MLGLWLRDAAATVRVREGYWFAPRRYGYGATPVTKAGWALTFGYAALLGLVVLWMPTSGTRLGVGIALTTMFVTIVWRKTDGGWRWRWGPGS